MELFYAGQFPASHWQLSPAAGRQQGISVPLAIVKMTTEPMLSIQKEADARLPL
jgi:hypothetical protein